MGRAGRLVASRGWYCFTAGPVRPPLTPATSLGTLEAGCCVLPLSGDQELLDRPPRLERRQELPPGAEGCPRVMLPLAPRSAGPN